MKSMSGDNFDLFTVTLSSVLCECWCFSQHVAEYELWLSVLSPQSQSGGNYRDEPSPATLPPLSSICLIYSAHWIVLLK